MTEQEKNIYIPKFEKKQSNEVWFWTEDIACFDYGVHICFDDIKFDMDNNCKAGLIFEWQDHLGVLCGDPFEVKERNYPTYSEYIHSKTLKQ